ncbi:MAG: 50S ribosomal protein L11 methyltransferase [Proteobacteria bacterium]|nr:50S ribosomal protein L11 methyltransferase [Pseudomonadota bacterium]
MWQVKIPFKNEEEKEKIILSSYLNNSKGLQESDKDLIIFFENKEDSDGFKSSFTNKEIFVEKVSQKIDWLSKWKRFHKIIRIPPFLIVPSFKKIKKPLGFKKIIINPSFAFGTGSHPTTKMCIKFLIDEVKKGDTVLDLGCGSAILSICAEKLGALRVFAVDIDEIAIKEAKKNIIKNRCKNISLSTSLEKTDKFDIIVCNILLTTILELKWQIDGALKKGGKLILSGILKEQTDELMNAFSDYKLLKRRTLKDKNYHWISFLYEKI